MAEWLLDMLGEGDCLLDLILPSVSLVLPLLTWPELVLDCGRLPTEEFGCLLALDLAIEPMPFSASLWLLSSSAVVVVRETCFFNLGC